MYTKFRKIVEKCHLHNHLEHGVYIFNYFAYLKKKEGFKTCTLVEHGCVPAPFPDLARCFLEVLVKHSRSRQ